MPQMPNNNIYTLFPFDTEYSADSVEWCPHKPHQNVFVCANYYLSEDKLEDGSQKRLGRIMLFSVSKIFGLKLHQIIDPAAVLDQKWCHRKINDCLLLGVVNSVKRIEIYKLHSEKVQLELLTFMEFPSENDNLILSLDWSTGIYETNEPEIVCSDSNGKIHLLVLIDNELVLQRTWEGHEFEAWITAFYYWDTNIFFSGGDDGVFLKFDKRIKDQCVSKNRSHNAGVTSLHSNRFRENILASGSYDEYVRLWDIRNMKSDINSIKMPGTLWRLKWNPFDQRYLLAACMLGGVHILNAENSEMEIVASYYEHKNISYGADWSYLDSDSCKQFGSDASAIVATCSFYDHLLCVSKYVSIV